MSANRMERINSQIQKELSLIINNKVNDTRISGFVSVLRVDTTPDLKYCKVYVSIFDKDKQAAFDAINSASGFIRKNLASSVKLREVPRLTFVLDDGIEYSDKINKIIRDLDIKQEEIDETNSEDN